jgi:hypothetical protein
MRWRVIGPSAKPIVCGIYGTAAGVEVRCHWEQSIDALIRSELARDMDTAREIADEWKRAVIGKGFTEVEGRD